MDTPKNELGCLAKEFRSALEARLAGDATGEYRLPLKHEVAEFCRTYLETLFPLHFAPSEEISPQIAHLLEEQDARLEEQLIRAFRFELSCSGKEPPGELLPMAVEVVGKIRERLPHLASLLGTDLQAAMKNDPAAAGLEEILRYAHRTRRRKT